MKKVYVNPSLEVVKIEIHQMLAASPNSAFEEVGGGSQLGREFGDEFDDEFDYEFGE